MGIFFLHLFLRKCKGTNAILLFAINGFPFYEAPVIFYLPLISMWVILRHPMLHLTCHSVDNRLTADCPIKCPLHIDFLCVSIIAAGARKSSDMQGPLSSGSAHPLLLSVLTFVFLFGVSLRF